MTSSWKMGTEFVQPIGSVVSRSSPKGDWKVVMSREDSASGRLSYPTYKSSMPPQARPANVSVRWSGMGVTPEC